MATSSDAEAKKDLLVQIKQETESLDEMVRNLLAITRIDAGALELRRDWIDLREIVDRVTSAARRHGARQHIDVALPADLPLVRADATLVEQAIGNVIGNAIVHTPPETRVLVDAIVGPNEIALRVTDDGPGIPAQALPQYSTNSSRPIRRRPTADREPASVSPSPRASWRRMAARSRPRAPMQTGAAPASVLTFPRQDVPA